MNQKEFNNLINNISEFTGSFSQILYQIIILLFIYNLFNNISFKNVSRHKPFILLISLIVLGIDWFIWQNKTQTILFMSILLIYISYNIYLKNNMENYINIINDCKNIYNHNKKIYEKRKEILTEFHNNDLKQIEEFTYTPPEPITFQENPTPYIKTGGLNELGIAYNSPINSQHITDSKYAETMLNALYDTSQYKAIKSNCIDKSLDNDIHKSPEVNIDITKFKNPEKNFLDERWLTQNEMTYNDNCSGCRRNLLPKARNAICTVVEFGNELENCSNQENTIKPEQLKIISNNNVPSMDY